MRIPSVLIGVEWFFGIEEKLPEGSSKLEAPSRDAAIFWLYGFVAEDGGKAAFVFNCLLRYDITLSS